MQFSAFAPMQTARHVAALNVGVLLPQSAVSIDIHRRVLAGMQMYIRQNAAAMQLTTAEVGPGSYALVRGAQHLLAEQQSGVLVAFANPDGANALQSIVDGRATTIVAGLGANVLRQNERGAATVHHSLGYWQASYALGHWAAQHLGRRAIIATSFYDSGYDTLYAFKHSFEAAGGTVLDTLVSHKPMDSDGHLAAQLKAIRSAQPDFVYAIYSGREAQEFVQSYATSDLAGRIPLAGASLSFEGGLLPQTPALLAHTVMPWSHTMPNDEGLAFVTNYEAALGSKPDLFALLGYETAQLASVVASSTDGTGQKYASIRTAASCDALQRDADGCFVAPFYLSTVHLNPGVVHTHVSELVAMPELDNHWIAALHTGERSGWTNVYPFA